MIEWLQNWYRDQCDGNWEHDYGIKILTIDNPGWSVTVDLNYTDTVIKEIAPKLIEISESNWVNFKIHQNTFKGAGDPSKLGLIISIFKDLVENGKVDKELVLSKMKSAYPH